MEIVKKTDWSKYKEDLWKKKLADLAIIEDFIASSYYEQFFGKLLSDVINNYEVNILNDESPETYDKLYSMKEVNIRIRKALLAIKNSPLETLKRLEKSIDVISKTE